MNNEIISTNKGINSIITKKKTRIINQITGWMVVLILGGLMTVTYGSVRMYKIYTTSKTQREAVQYSVDNGYMLELEFENGAEMEFVADPDDIPSKLEGKLKNKDIEKIVVKPAR